MANTINFLDLRSRGLTKLPQYRQSLKQVKCLLENHAAESSLNQVCTLEGEPRATFLLEFSPDHRLVASTHGDHSVRVTDVQTGKCTHILKGHPRTPWCLAFSPVSSDILASGCLGGEVHIWDLRGGGSEVLRNPNEGQVITSLAFSPAGDAVVFATLNKIFFWAWTRSKPFALTQTKYEFERVRWVRFDPFGHYLYTGIANNPTGHKGVAGPTSFEAWSNLQNEDDVQRRMVNQQTVPEQQQGSGRNLLRATSPVQEERLDLARRYAQHVTAIMRSQRIREAPSTNNDDDNERNDNQEDAAPDNRVPRVSSQASGASGRLLSGVSRRVDTVSNWLNGSAFAQTSATSGRRERRGAWGRYRPAFFSSNHGERRFEGFRNNTDMSEDFEDDNSSNDSNNNNYPSSQRYSETRETSSLLNLPQTNQEHEVIRPSFFRALNPALRPSLRRDISLDGPLQNDEFEILPVDQAETLATRRERSGPPSTSLATTRERSGPPSTSLETTRERSGPPSTSQHEQDAVRNEENVNYKWDELRSFWTRCCDNERTTTNGASSSMPATQQMRRDPRLSGSFVYNNNNNANINSVTSEGNNVINRSTGNTDRETCASQAARCPTTTPLLRNSDPFMGCAGSSFDSLQSRPDSTSTSLDTNQTTHGTAGSSQRHGEKLLSQIQLDVVNKVCRERGDQASSSGTIGNSRRPFEHVITRFDQTKNESHGSNSDQQASCASMFGRDEPSDSADSKGKKWKNKTAGQPKCSKQPKTHNHGLRESHRRFRTSKDAEESCSNTDESKVLFQCSNSDNNCDILVDSVGTSTSGHSVNVQEPIDLCIRPNQPSTTHQSQSSDLSAISLNVSNDEESRTAPLTENDENNRAVFSGDHNYCLQSSGSSLVITSSASVSSEACSNSTTVPSLSSRLTSATTTTSGQVYSGRFTSLPQERREAANSLYRYEIIAGIEDNSRSIEESERVEEVSDTSTVTSHDETMSEDVDNREEEGPCNRLEQLQLDRDQDSDIPGDGASNSDSGGPSQDLNTFSRSLERWVSELDRRISDLEENYQRRIHSLYSRLNNYGRDRRCARPTPSQRSAELRFGRGRRRADWTESSTSTVSAAPSARFTRRERSRGRPVPHPWARPVPHPAAVPPHPVVIPHSSAIAIIDSDIPERETTINYRFEETQSNLSAPPLIPRMRPQPAPHRWLSLWGPDDYYQRSLRSNTTNTHNPAAVTSPLNLTTRAYVANRAHAAERHRQARERLRIRLYGNPSEESQEDHIVGSSRNEYNNEAPDGASETEFESDAQRMRRVIEEHDNLRDLERNSRHQSGTDSGRSSLRQRIGLSNFPNYGRGRSIFEGQGLVRSSSFRQDQRGSNDIPSMQNRGYDDDEDVPAADGDEVFNLHPDYDDNNIPSFLHLQNETIQNILGNSITGPYRNRDPFRNRDEHVLRTNFVPQTHRIQRWSMAKVTVPDISNPTANIVVRYCKIHNDASCCLSQDGSLLAAFVPTRRGVPDKLILGVFSVKNDSLGQCLYTKSCGQNAVSVSISPENNYLLMGLAARRMFLSTGQIMGKVYKLVQQKAGESSMRGEADVLFPESRSLQCSVNSVRWLPQAGLGLVFGTNKGDFVFCRPSCRKIVERDDEAFLSDLRIVGGVSLEPSIYLHGRRLFSDRAAQNRARNSWRSTFLRFQNQTGSSILADPRHRTSGTQTTEEGIQRTAATQTRDGEASTSTSGV